MQLSLVAAAADSPRGGLLDHDHHGVETPLQKVDRPEFGLSLGSVVCEVQPSYSYVLAVPLNHHAGALEGAILTNPGESPAPGPTRRTLYIRISRDVVADELAAMLGGPADGPVRFTRAVDPSRHDDGITPLVQQLVEALLGGGDALLLHPHILLRQVRTLVAALLLARPHNFTDPLVLGQSPPRPRTLRRTQRFMAENLAENLTLTDLATAAGCSTRTLNSTFREHLGVSPMAYLRNLRLERVRDQLLSLDEPIGSIAYRWGFTHLGRFAGVYHHRFGELPSQTAFRRRA